MQKYRTAGVQPFGVNPASVEVHRQHAEKLGLPFPLLSDNKREVARAFGALRLGRIILLSVVLIDQDAIVRFAARGAPRADQSLAVLGLWRE